MTFMNARKRNKTLTYIIVIMVSVGLILSVSIGYFAPMGDSSGTVSSPEMEAVQDFNTAMSLIHQGKFTEAAPKFLSSVNGFEKALKNDPDNIMIMGDLATSYFYTGNTDKAIELAEKVLEISPDYSKVRFNYAIFLAHGKNNYSQAVKELQKIKKGDPNYQNAQELIAEFSKSALPAPPPAPGK